MKSNKTSHIFLLATALIYGANYTIAKEVLSNDFITPMGLVFFRASSAFVLFFIFHSLFVKEKVEKKDLKDIFLMSLFGVIINQSFFIIGLKYTTPINAALLITVVPILVFVFSAIILKERITLIKILGITLGFAGVMTIILNRGTVSINIHTLKGDILVFLNSASYAYYLVKVKPLFKKYNPVTITKWMFFFSVICLLPFSFNEILTVKWEYFDMKLWLSFGYVLVFTTFLAYLLNNFALQKTNPSVVSIYIYLQPVIATVIALILSKDTLNLEKVIAGILIFTGIYLVSYNKKNET